MEYTITDPLLLDINIESFEYKKGEPILQSIKKQVYNVTRPGVLQGQVIAILGPSGIGKSTFFENIAGLLHPTKGMIKAYDKNTKEFTTIKVGDVGMVYQSYQLYPFLTAKQQLELGARKGGLTTAETTEKIDFYLSHFHLKAHAHKYPNQLSGGQRQRLAIAQQLLCSNTILLMDEPFSGLDPLLKNNVCELIADIAQLDELMTIIIVSHDIDAALSIADTVWLMGRIPNTTAATIVETIDLMEKGLAWKKNIQYDSRFIELCQYIKERFPHLI
jgi:ABC-type nitrate/sulfonate/bicarbonate transport system ATPase subunit